MLQNLDLNSRVMRGRKCECFTFQNGRKLKMEKTLAPIVECVSGKHVYQDAEDASNKPAERLICQGCFALVGKGISHSFAKLERQKNLTAIVIATSPTSQGKVLSSSIKEKHLSF